jgi:hypothetical protein
MAQADIDLLKPERHLVDLYSHSDGDFGDTDNLIISDVLADILFVEYVDLVDEGGDFIERNGIAVPVNTLTSAWRKARVLLIGPEVKYTKVGDYVIFPNNLGVTVNKLPVALTSVNEFTLQPMVTKYITKKGVFLNEDRIFGKCKYVGE